jgi:hypothetical protein
MNNVILNPNQSIIFICLLLKKCHIWGKRTSRDKFEKSKVRKVQLIWPDNIVTSNLNKHMDITH